MNSPEMSLKWNLSSVLFLFFVFCFQSKSPRPIKSVRTQADVYVYNTLRRKRPFSQPMFWLCIVEKGGVTNNDNNDCALFKCLSMTVWQLASNRNAMKIKVEQLHGIQLSLISTLTPGIFLLWHVSRITVNTAPVCTPANIYSWKHAICNIVAIITVWFP